MQNLINNLQGVYAFSMTDFKNMDVISITDFSESDITRLCEEGKRMFHLEMDDLRYSLCSELRDKALAYMFYEPSTRTRTRFITGMRELGGSSDGFSGTEGTSVMKKETIRDTIKMMEANHFDVIVMRHPLDGSLQWAADVADIPVINGGDGKNEHPTQALLDILTLYMHNDGKLDNLSIGFGGDLSHGRTIRSLSLALSHFKNMTIRWAAEDFLGMPKDLEDILKSKGVSVIREKEVKDVLKKVRSYYMTRPQIERMKGVSPEMVDKLMERYRIDLSKVEGSDLKLLMHPLPVNSEIAEIDYRVYFRECQGFFHQAEFGVLLSKALLYEMLKDTKYARFSGALNPGLEFGNNRLKRRVKGETKKGRFIDKIDNGVVLDHLVYPSAIRVSEALDLTKRRYDSISADMAKMKISFLKTNLMELAERELKRAALISPDPTVNYVRDGKVIDKFVYLLCKNDNCVTRAVNEDVPPKFYDDEGKIRCRYCRRSYDVKNRKVSARDISSYIASLPKKIERVYKD
jgi:aspartate carbamoyltransferase catalytic subunit